MATFPQLEKKTKKEILEEYQKLLADKGKEDMKKVSTSVDNEQKPALFDKVGRYTVDEMNGTISDFKSDVHKTLDELADRLTGEARKFSELSEAIELSKKELELHHNIKVSADALDRLTADYRAKSVALEEEIADAKRNWAREQEEQGYDLTLRTRRAEEEFKETKNARDRVLRERELELSRHEKEFGDLRAQVEGFPARLEKALKEHAQETERHMRGEFDAEMKSANKDWELQKSTYEMRIAHLENNLKTQQFENVISKKELEAANKRVQELAVRIIESGSRYAIKPEVVNSQPAAISQVK